MEHLVKTLTTPDDLVAEIAAGFPEDEAEDLTPEQRESRFQKNIELINKRISSSSFKDVADRHLKDKTDAIAHIIRNIAEQCSAAVESLQLAQDADLEEQRERGQIQKMSSRRGSNLSAAASDDGRSTATSDIGDDSHLRPSSGRTSSIPPTPDLIPNRSSTSMSIASTATTPERISQQYVIGHDIPTKIVEDDEDDLEDDRSENDPNPIPQEPGVVGKHAESLIHRPSGARISALGGTR
jgi:hypothetical protein